MIGTTADMTARPEGERRPILSMVAILGTAYFVLVIAAMHFLRPDISPVQRPTSEYAVGSFGYLMTSAFISLSVGSWALVMGLHPDVSRARSHRVGLGLLGLWGTGLLVAAIFPIDLDGAPTTLAGSIHTNNGPLTFLSLVVGVNLVSRGFRQHENWRPIHRLASGLALLMIPVFIAGGAAAARESGAGIAQRVLIVTFVTWFLLASVRLRSNAIRTIGNRTT